MIDWNINSMNTSTLKLIYWPNWILTKLGWTISTMFKLIKKLYIIVAISLKHLRTKYFN